MDSSVSRWFLRSKDFEDRIYDFLMVGTVTQYKDKQFSRYLDFMRTMFFTQEKEKEIDKMENFDCLSITKLNVNICYPRNYNLKVSFKI